MFLGFLHVKYHHLIAFLQGKYPPNKIGPERTCMQNIKGGELHEPEILQHKFNFSPKYMFSSYIPIIWVRLGHLYLQAIPSEGFV